MTREEALIQLRIGPGINEDVSEEYNKAVDMAIKALEQEPCEKCCNGNQTEKAKLCQKSYITGMEHSRWTALTKRPMTKEEREEYEERTGITEFMILNCPLPEDGQEVLISYGGYVSIDTFHNDDGCYFENVEIDDVEAWQELPLPYKVESEDK